jgi:glyoxylase-like metal-dependent hydrolase (beta-lactamase superfamily II)
MKPQVEHFFDARTWTLTFLVWDAATRDAVIIDPVLDYDPLSVRIFEESLDKVTARVGALGLRVVGILETHAHADHLSGGHRLRERLGAPIAIGARIAEVQALFAGVFHTPLEIGGAGYFDKLLADHEDWTVGSLTIHAHPTPGHTPACMSYQIGDALFTGDALFMPDYGTGRCDFPRGSAEDLYDSVQALYQLPDETRVFVGHDYQPGGREPRAETTIGESKAHNLQLRADTPRAAFVSFRTTRDRSLRPPNLIFQSLQVNIRAGALPPAESNGRAYLKLPIGLFGG